MEDQVSSGPTPEQTTPGTVLQAAGRLSVEEFTHAAFSAVLRATEAQQLPRGPIIYGIIYMPEASSFRGISTPGEGGQG